MYQKVNRFFKAIKCRFVCHSWIVGLRLPENIKLFCNHCGKCSLSSCSICDDLKYKIEGLTISNIALKKMVNKLNKELEKCKEHT